MPKDESILLRLSHADKEIIKRAALQREMSVSEYIRRCALSIAVQGQGKPATGQRSLLEDS